MMMMVMVMVLSALSLILQLEAPGEEATMELSMEDIQILAKRRGIPNYTIDHICRG